MIRFHWETRKTRKTKKVQIVTYKKVHFEADSKFLKTVSKLIKKLFRL